MNELIRIIRDRAKDGVSIYPVSHETGRLLQILVEMSRAEKMLEIGLGYGVSTLYIAYALPRCGQMDSIEVSENNAAVAAKYIEKAGFSSSVNVITGDARTVLRELQDPYDGVFLDIDVEYYCGCLDEIIRVTKPGGFILSENIWDEPTAYEIGGSQALESIKQYQSRVYGHKQLNSCAIDECILSLKRHLVIARKD